MSTKITADNGAEIQVGQLGITVEHPEGIASIWARLSPEQRSALADALDPQRQGWTLADLDRLRTTLANPKAGGQWTREDLPSVMDLVKASVDAMATELGGGADAALDAVVAHLNAHHPKSVHPMDPEKARLRRERDEARNARDTAATRAKQLEREVSKVEGRASEWSIKAQEWRVRAEAAEARPWTIALDDKASPVFMPAVTRDEIEKVVEAVFDREAGYAHGSDSPWPGTLPVASAVWDYLKGADPAVHVVRESHIHALTDPEDARDFALADGQWEFRNPTESDLDHAWDEVEADLRYLIAVRRVREAEQAVDPVADLALQIETATRDAIRTVVDSLTAVAPGLTPPDVEGLLYQTIRDQSHTLAVHVLGQEVMR